MHSERSAGANQRPVRTGDAPPLNVAFATLDGERLLDDHFGEAPIYRRASLGPGGLEFLGSFENDSGEEEEQEHGDPEKARRIASLLARNDVQVLVARQFGPNIRRISRRFVPVLVRVERVEDAVPLLLAARDAILRSWQAGESRRAVVLR